MNRSKLALTVLLVIFAVALLGCSSNYTLTRAYVVDWISNVEEDANAGVYVFWVRYDPTSAYCTTDAALARQVAEYANGVDPVRLHYKGKQVDGVDNNCDSHGRWSHKYDGVTVYTLISVEWAIQAE